MGTTYRRWRRDRETQVPEGSDDRSRSVQQTSKAKPWSLPRRQRRRQGRWQVVRRHARVVVSELDVAVKEGSLATEVGWWLGEPRPPGGLIPAWQSHLLVPRL